MLKRTTMLAALAVAFVLPAPAGAATVQGVVVAKNPLRKAIVVASANGSLRTVATARWRATRIGARVTISGRALRVTGRATKARIRAVVVRYERAKARYVVAGGGTVFSFRYAAGRTLAASAQQPTQAGAQIAATVDTTASTPTAQHVTQLGVVGTLTIEGIVTELAGSTIKLVVPQVGFVTLVAPAGFDLSSLEVFDVVRARVAVGANGFLSVLSLHVRRTSVGAGTGGAGDHDDSDDTEDAESDESEDHDESEDDD